MSCSPCYRTADLIDIFCLSKINDDGDGDDDKWTIRLGP